MIDRILLAVDGSQNAVRASDIAAELASKLAADLFIVHVMMHGRPSAELVRMAEVEHIVTQAQQVVSPGVSYITGSHPELLGGPVDDPRTARIIFAVADQIVAKARTRCEEKTANVVLTSIRSGDYADEILEAAQEFDADLIVVGSRGLGVLGRTVLGSVSQKVLHHAECSVLCVR